MELIEHIEVGSGGAASIEFTSIPATYTDLVLKVSVRHSRAGYDTSAMGIQFNSDTASNYSWRILNGDGSSPASYNDASDPQALVGYAPGPAATSNVFSNNLIYIPNYTSSSAKSISTDSVTENNATSATQNLSASLWTGTAAINSIKLFESGAGSTLVQYSSATLYGITAGSDGTTTVS